MPSSGNGRMLSTLALVGQLGAIMVGCIFAGFLAGWYLDRLFNTSPVVTLVLIVVGVAGGMVATYRLVMQTLDSEQRDR